jgi:Kef-type K+ transport system membrane component KefB
MTVILIILTAAAVGMGIARWLNVPLVPLLVLSGIGIASLNLADDPQLFQDALVLGLTFLVFNFGTEINPDRVERHGRTSIFVGLAQFFSLGLIGMGVALLLGWDWLPALYMALALAASSTLVVIRVLSQRQQLFEPFGRLVVGVLLIQDLLIILLIAAVAHIEDGLSAAFVSVNGTLGLMVLAYVGLRWVTPWLLVTLDLDEEERLLVVLAILFLFIGASYLIGVPIVVGAFLAGISLSSFPVSGLFRGQLTSLSDFFLAVFFVALGTTLILPSTQELLLALTLIVLVLLVTPVLVSLIARQARLTSRASLEAGLLLAQTSEFSLIVGLVGVQQGHLDNGTLSVIAIVTVVTMILTPIIATDQNTIRLLHWFDRWRQPEVGSTAENHVVLIGCGGHGLDLLKWLLEHDQKVMVIDDDRGVVEQVEELGGTAVLGDATNPRILKAAGADKARIIVSTMRRLINNEKLLSHTGEVKTVFSVFEPDQAERLRAHGGIPILESHAAADELLHWFERECQ